MIQRRSESRSWLDYDRELVERQLSAPNGREGNKIGDLNENVSPQELFRELSRLSSGRLRGEIEQMEVKLSDRARSRPSTTFVSS